jgi:signal transduction histidine kinase/CheY-like chemotaxis protein
VRSREPDSALPAADRPHRLQRWWLDLSLRAKGLIVIAVPLIALLSATSANLILQHSENQERSVGLAARNLENAANLVLSDAVNAETGIRGYAATRDPLFLDPYNVTLARIGAERGALRAAAIAEGDSRQEQVVDMRTGKVLFELAQLRSAISRGLSIRNLIPPLEAAKTTMDVLRREVADIDAGPAVLAAAQHAKISRLTTRIDLLDVATLALGLLAGLAGVALFTSGISRRVGANAANARRLGEGQPLEPIVYAGDEIGQVAESHLRADALLASRAVELTTARDQALKATQAKNAFLSNTSHELRTPLNSVLGFTQLLQLSDLSDEDNDSVERILGAGRHLLALINELIDIARIESGELSLSVEPVSLLPLIEEVSELMAPLAAERSIAIVQHCGLPGLAARADRRRFSQVLVNLISNAVKYNRRGGTITITCREEDNSQLSVVIADTGQGLAPGDLERVFMPFERLGAEQTGIEGTGIGLPLSKALTEAMGGRLSASSVLGEGSAFTVTLPRAPDEIHVPPRDTAPAPRTVLRPPAGATINLLYIEDNPSNIEVVSRYIRGRSHAKLSYARSGRAGIERAVRDVPDIILLDLHLPDLHGDQALKELKAEPVTAAIPVVVLSAEATPGIIRRLLASGATAYLTKPLDLADLGALLDSFMAPAQVHQASIAIRRTSA